MHLNHANSHEIELVLPADSCICIREMDNFVIYFPERCFLLAEKRRQERQQKKDAWDGSYGKCAMDM